MEKEWTVLVYADGRNRLAHSTALALNKLEAVGSSKDVHVVAQATMEPTLMERIYPEIRSMPTRRFYIQRDKDDTHITSPVVGDMGETQPLSEQSLTDFVKWGVQSFPAKRYMLIVKKHGLGFAKSEPAAPLSARDMRSALEQVEKDTGRKMDVIAFDSCSMQQLEVAHELKDRASVMVGSQEDIFAVDYPYQQILAGLGKDVDASAAGALIVDAHRKHVSRGMQTAVALNKVGAASAAIKGVVDAVISEAIPREVVYTNMLKTASMEPQESMRLVYNFRDIRGFLQGLAKDPRVTSETVRQAALSADQALQDSIIDHSLPEWKKTIKDAQGYTAFIPWKAQMGEAYGKLAFDRDAEWSRLTNYVFENHEDAPEREKISAYSGLSLTQKIGKFAIGQYKKYISAYLAVSCRCRPSCSQYTREAVEKMGLVEGTKLGFMRLLACAGAQGVIDDPVPGTSGEVPPPAPEILVQPPTAEPKSAARRRIERTAIGLTHMTGRLIGGLAGAVACLPAGVAMGAMLGWKAGRATIDVFNRELLTRYRRESVRKLVELEHLVGDPGFATYKKVRSITGSDRVARTVGGVVGGVIGGTAGLLGALYKGYRWGALFGGLWGANALKDALGELPVHPGNEAILRQDYGR